MWLELFIGVLLCVYVSCNSHKLVSLEALFLDGGLDFLLGFNSEDEKNRVTTG